LTARYEVGATKKNDHQISEAAEPAGITAVDGGTDPDICGQAERIGERRLVVVSRKPLFAAFFATADVFQLAVGSYEMAIDYGWE